MANKFIIVHRVYRRSKRFIKIYKKFIKDKKY